MQAKRALLFYDPRDSMGVELRRYLESDGASVTVTASLARACYLLGRGTFDLVVVDVLHSSSAAAKLAEIANRRSVRIFYVTAGSLLQQRSGSTRGRNSRTRRRRTLSGPRSV
jgi:DNA-binding response OmpR family regulator